MSWWQLILLAMGVIGLFSMLSHISDKADQAAKDAAMLRYELEQFTGWAQRAVEIQLTKQRTTLARLHWIREQMGWQPPTNDDSLV